MRLDRIVYTRIETVASLTGTEHPLDTRSVLRNAPSTSLDRQPVHSRMLDPEMQLLAKFPSDYSCKVVKKLDARCIAPLHRNTIRLRTEISTTFIGETNLARSLYLLVENYAIKQTD